MHMLNLQMIVSIAYMQIVDVCITLGHNNDQGTYVVTGTKALMKSMNKYLLGDCGYHDFRITTPNSVRTIQVHGENMSLRSLVENAFTDLQQRFGYVTRKSRFVPELHSLVLMVCCQLTALDLHYHPRNFEI